MQSAKGTCILSAVSEQQILTLERTFAVFTPDGWAVPEWLVMLQAAITGESVEIVTKEQP